MAVANAEALKPEIYTWTFPGAPIRIALSLEVVRRLRKEIEELLRLRPHATGAGGILLGKAAGRTKRVEILDFRAVDLGNSGDSQGSLCAADLEKLRSFVEEADHSPGRLPVVGYYRIRLGGNLQLTEQDLSVMQGGFSDPSNVCLLIRRTEKGSADAGFFFWEDGRMNGEFSYMDFPFDEALLAEMRQPFPDRAEFTGRPAMEPVAPAPAPVPARVSEPGKNVGLQRMLWMVVLCAALIVIGAAGYRFSLSQPSPSRTAAANDEGVGLQVERHGVDLRVRWRRNATLVENARVGILTIKDGQSEQTLYLDLPQLHTGSVLYTPVTDKIHFRLEIFTSDGKSGSEAVLAVMGRPSSPAQGAAAQQTAARVITETARPALPATSARPTAGKPDAGNKDQIRSAAIPLSTQPAASKPEPKPFTWPAAPEGSNETARTIFIDPPAAPAGENASLPEAAIPSRSASPQLPAPQLPAPSPSQTAAVEPAHSPQAKSAPSPVPAVAPAKPAAGQERPADSESFVPAAPVRKVNPVIDPTLKFMLSRETTVDVRIRIDASGKVVKAEAVNRDGSVAGFISTASVNAARLWIFQPARRGGRALPSDLVVQFKFSPAR